MIPFKNSERLWMANFFFEEFAHFLIHWRSQRDKMNTTKKCSFLLVNEGLKLYPLRDEVPNGKMKVSNGILEL